MVGRRVGGAVALVLILVPEGGQRGQRGELVVGQLAAHRLDLGGEGSTQGV